MAEVVKLKISSAVAEFVRPGVTVEKKLTGIQTALSFEPSDRITLLFCLMKDADAGVKAAATLAFGELPEEDIITYVEAAAGHPLILNELAKVHVTKPAVVALLLCAEQIFPQVRQVLEQQQELFLDSGYDELSENPDMPEENPPCQDDYAELDESGEVEEESEQFLSKYKVAMQMGIGEKIKMALTGDKEWRAILIKDANKLVSGSVIKNPRITDGEILTLLKVGVQNDEIIRLICANKEWTKNYLIRRALVCCPRTPLPNSLRYLSTLNEKDVASFAKNKNISSVISTQAKRILLSKKR